ncbi:MAG: hypothetical protein AAF918_01680 [Pseudomonadota bacterium]
MIQITDIASMAVRSIGRKGHQQDWRSASSLEPELEPLRTRTCEGHSALALVSRRIHRTTFHQTDRAKPGPELLREALVHAGADQTVVSQSIEFPKGKAPRLTESEDWQLSLSHSGNLWLVGAAHARRIGVDLERPRRRDFLRLTRMLRWPPVEGAEFYRRWTLAEALFKGGAAPARTCFKLAGDTVPFHGGDEAETANAATANGWSTEVNRIQWQAQWLTTHDQALGCVAWSAAL